MTKFEYRIYNAFKTYTIPVKHEVGAHVYHQSSGQWYLYGARASDSELILVTPDMSRTAIVKEAFCTGCWNPESDPERFEEHVKESSKKKKTAQIIE